MSDSRQRNDVRLRDSEGNAYWNALVRSAAKPPGVGTVHKARVENGDVVEVACHNPAVETWVYLKGEHEGLQYCSVCSPFASDVPGVKKDPPLFRLATTEDYDPGCDYHAQ